MRPSGFIQELPRTSDERSWGSLSANGHKRAFKSKSAGNQRSRGTPLSYAAGLGPPSIATQRPGRQSIRRAACCEPPAPGSLP